MLSWFCGCFQRVDNQRTSEIKTDILLISSNSQTMDTTQLMDKEYDTPCGLTAISSLSEHKVLLECPIAGLAYHDISDVWDELYVGA